MPRYLLVLPVLAAMGATATAGGSAWKYVADDSVRPVPRTLLAQVRRMSPEMQLLLQSQLEERQEQLLRSEE